jgi:uncharacterized membrane protein
MDAGVHGLFLIGAIVALIIFVVLRVFIVHQRSDSRKKKAHQSRRVSSLLVGLYPITEHERRKSVQISVVLSVGTFG